MVVVDNRTPFPAELVSLLDTEGHEVRVLVVVSTFVWTGHPKLSTADEQEPICFGDVHRGDPASSSVVRESDVCPPKPLVDVLLESVAYAPAGTAVRSLSAGFALGDIRKELRVVGDRLGPTSIERFERMPIVYERAYGGSGASAAQTCRNNPVGIGFKGAVPGTADIRTAAPNIESANGATAGFGVVGRGWSPRLELAGSFDAEWLARQWPLPPKDFDSRHHQCAPIDQQSATIQGGETARLVNLTPDGMWVFQLPRLEVPVHVIRDAGPTTMPLRLDTIYIKPEVRSVVMCHRAILEEGRGVQEPHELVLGHMTPGWLAARCARKRYLDPAETHGEQHDRDLYS